MYALRSTGKVGRYTTNTTEKGNKLEDQLYDYLNGQLMRGENVFDAHPSNLCEVHKKKKYYCRDREADVEFDVVIEIRRLGRRHPHMRVILECKNHQKTVQDIYIREFSDKITNIFPSGAKGLVVSSSRLQSGAENVAKIGGSELSNSMNTESISLQIVLAELGQKITL